MTKIKNSGDETPATLDAAMAEIAKLKEIIEETTSEMEGQSIHITSLESTIAKAQKEGKLELEAIHNGVKYSVLSGANINGKVYTKAEIAASSEVIEEILAISNQGILKVVKEAE